MCARLRKGWDVPVMHAMPDTHHALRLHSHSVVGERVWPAAERCAVQTKPCSSVPPPNIHLSRVRVRAGHVHSPHM